MLACRIAFHTISISFQIALLRPHPLGFLNTSRKAASAMIDQSFGSRIFPAPRHANKVHASSPLVAPMPGAGMSSTAATAAVRYQHFKRRLEKMAASYWIWRQKSPEQMAYHKATAPSKAILNRQKIRPPKSPISSPAQCRSSAPCRDLLKSRRLEDPNVWTFALPTM